MKRKSSPHPDARRSLILDAMRRHKAGSRWLLALTIAALAGGIVLLRTSPSGPAPPVIPTNGLDPAIIRVVEEALQGVRAASRSGEAWGRLGSTLMHYEYLPETRAAFEQAARWSPRDPRWPYLEGVFLMNYDADAALAKLRRATELAAGDVEMPRLRLGHFLAERGRMSEAASEFHIVLMHHASNSPAALGLARLQHQRGSFTNCVHTLEVCQGDPHTRKAAQELLASTHRALGRFDNARAAARAAAALPPDLPWPDSYLAEAGQYHVGLKVELERASSLLDAGHPVEAAVALTRASRSYPEEAEVWYLLGWALNRQQDSATAESALRRHLGLAGDSPKGHAQLAVALLGQGRFAEAIPILEKGLRLKPTWRELHSNLGFAHAHLGHMTDAEREYRAALVCDPNHRPTYAALAEALTRLGRGAEAQEVLKQAEALGTEIPAVSK